MHRRWWRAALFLLRLRSLERNWEFGRSIADPGKTAPVWGVLGPGSVPNRHGAGIRGHSRAQCAQIPECGDFVRQELQIVLYSASEGLLG